LITVLSSLTVIFLTLVIILVQDILSGRKDVGLGRRYGLNRHALNPIISPKSHHDWEAEGAFNPTAVEDSHGKIHLFYRAAGRDGLSRIGHATSRDGVHVGSQSPFPVYEPLHGYGMPEASEANLPHHHDPAEHPSGGGLAA